MPSLEIPSIAKFEVTVDEIVQLSQALLKETKQAKVRAALRRMVDEVQKGNKVLVEEVLQPLYGLVDQASFDKSFVELRARYKGMLLNGASIISKINCWQVTQQLEALRGSRRWRKSIPWLGRSITKLELLTDNWIANDAVMYESDREMLEAINTFLDEIDAVRQRNAKAAFRQLRSGLTEFESAWLAVRDRFAELSLLHDQL